MDFDVDGLGDWDAKFVLWFFFGLVHVDINLDFGFRGMVGGMLSLCCGGWLRAIREGRKSLCSSSGLRISPDPHN